MPIMDDKHYLISHLYELEDQLSELENLLIEQIDQGNNDETSELISEIENLSKLVERIKKAVALMENKRLNNIRFGARSIIHGTEPVENLVLPVNSTGNNHNSMIMRDEFISALGSALNNDDMNQNISQSSNNNIGTDQNNNIDINQSDNADQNNNIISQINMDSINRIDNNINLISTLLMNELNRRHNRQRRRRSHENNDSDILRRNILNIISNTPVNSSYIDEQRETLFNFPSISNNVGQSYEQLRNLEDYKIPLKKKLLKKIKVERFSRAEVREDYTQCSICLCEFEESDRVRVLPCTHVYHRNCIDKWFDESVKCPVCNADIRDQLRKNNTKHKSRNSIVELEPIT